MKCCEVKSRTPIFGAHFNLVNQPTLREDLFNFFH